MTESDLTLPEDITTLSGDELKTFVSAAIARIKELNSSDSVELAVQTAEATEMSTLAKAVKRVQLEEGRRTTEAASNANAKTEAAELLASIEAANAGDKDKDKTDKQPVTASATTQPRDMATANNFRNPSLADAQRGAPEAPAPRLETLMVASADIPSIAAGAPLPDMLSLANAINARAKSVPISRRGDEAPRYNIASINREHRFTLDPNSSLAELNAVLTAATNPEILTAAGGWCAPSEISYDFFNLVCDDGGLDLPTVGINRGGIRWPISPSFADVTASTALWTWTETQDIAAVTGTAQSGTKTCGRVPCVTFDEERLHCDGVCLTVGNLTEDAYPELIANFTKLLMSAHFHKINRARIDELRAMSASFTTTNGDAGSGVVAPVLGALELQAIDYRSRYAMCEGALLEVVAPRWLRAMMRSDLRKRMGGGTELLSVTDSYLMGLFDAIGIRVQWVADYQERTTGFPGVPTTIPTAWPTTVEFMMMAPGTVVLGQGLRLDLGIIRDSILNETNDYTAMWMEECWLMFQPGHEVRRLTVNICPDGTTGAADLTACSV